MWQYRNPTRAATILEDRGCLGQQEAVRAARSVRSSLASLKGTQHVRGSVERGVKHLLKRATMKPRVKPSGRSFPSPKQRYEWIQQARDLLKPLYARGPASRKLSEVDYGRKDPRLGHLFGPEYATAAKNPIEKCGDCFRWALWEAVNNGGLLVHGWVVHPIFGNELMAHAWVERDGWVYDWQHCEQGMGMCPMSHEDFAEVYQPRGEKSYRGSPRLIGKAYNEGHYGPWHSPPWSDPHWRPNPRGGKGRPGHGWLKKARQPLHYLRTEIGNVSRTLDQIANLIDELQSNLGSLRKSKYHQLIGKLRGLTEDSDVIPLLESLEMELRQVGANTSLRPAKRQLINLTHTYNINEQRRLEKYEKMRDWAMSYPWIDVYDNALGLRGEVHFVSDDRRLAGFTIPKNQKDNFTAYIDSEPNYTWRLSRKPLWLLADQPALVIVEALSLQSEEERKARLQRRKTKRALRKRRRP